MKLLETAQDGGFSCSGASWFRIVEPTDLPGGLLVGLVVGSLLRITKLTGRAVIDRQGGDRAKMSFFNRFQYIFGSSGLNLEVDEHLQPMVCLDCAYRG
ncbi:hypothetical protein U1Q18_016375 [Sarracenia purpurea var. burkii]